MLHEGTISKNEAELRKPTKHLICSEVRTRSYNPEGSHGRSWFDLHLSQRATEHNLWPFKRSTATADTCPGREGAQESVAQVLMLFSPTRCGRAGRASSLTEAGHASPPLRAQSGVDKVASECAKAN